MLCFVYPRDIQAGAVHLLSDLMTANRTIRVSVGSQKPEVAKEDQQTAERRTGIRGQRVTVCA